MFKNTECECSECFRFMNEDKIFSFDKGYEYGFNRGYKKGKEYANPKRKLYLPRYTTLALECMSVTSDRLNFARQLIYEYKVVNLEDIIVDIEFFDNYITYRCV